MQRHIRTIDDDNTQQRKFSGEPLAIPKNLANKQKATESSSKFFGFLNKNRDGNGKEKKNKKKEKSKKTKSDESKVEKYPAAFVPSKRIIENREYQNQKIIDENRLRRSDDSSEHSEKSIPLFRKFGDTNMLKNKRQINNSRNVKQQEENEMRNRKINPIAYDNQNDTGFSSLDADCNVPYQSTIKKSFNSRSNDKLQKRISDSSSNLSSSTDTNSLDSMEHEIIHRKPSNSENLSYLGPFNFRQLLR